MHELKTCFRSELFTVVPYSYCYLFRFTTIFTTTSSFFSSSSSSSSSSSVMSFPRPPSLVLSFTAIPRASFMVIVHSFSLIVIVLAAYFTSRCLSPPFRQDHLPRLTLFLCPFPGGSHRLAVELPRESSALASLLMGFMATVKY
ncbi:hypothetical protein E2C01_068180 [Portunus trituberculatus]|uniref:Uncharacterized protein n=1 Tax=Portunus trituberculatus TaxID=210409 RepID=A0A5B7HN79_PORTR|nr:hypothetical protein [Portunus trituberculatus]